MSAGALLPYSFGQLDEDSLSISKPVVDTIVRGLHEQQSSVFKSKCFRPDLMNTLLAVNASSNVCSWFNEQCSPVSLKRSPKSFNPVTSCLVNHSSLSLASVPILFLWQVVFTSLCLTPLILHSALVSQSLKLCLFKFPVKIGVVLFVHFALPLPLPLQYLAGRFGMLFNSQYNTPANTGHIP